MKLRIRGNSLRLRMQKSEVARFAKEGFLTETTQFGPDQMLSFSIESVSDLTDIRASFRNGDIRFFVPATVVTDWVQSDVVSLHSEMANESTDGKLRILIEKDFQCIKPRSVWNEDETDAFHNPNESCN